AFRTPPARRRRRRRRHAAHLGRLAPPSHDGEEVLSIRHQGGIGQRSIRQNRHAGSGNRYNALMSSALEKDLRRLVKGDVLCDDLSRTLYSTAACIFQMMPQGIVVPRDREDVVAVVKYAAGKGIPVTARGAGSGLAGQTLGEGIILDFSKNMSRILE